MRPLVLILTVLIAVCSTASAADYYASPSGNDANNGTSLEYAWATITHAFRTLPENDTCWIVDGTYTETGSSTSDIDSHTSVLNNSTTFRAYNGTPILNKASGDIGITLHNVVNVTIDGLKIQNFDTWNIWFYCADNNTITNCTIYNSGWKNVHLQYSKNNTISNCVIDEAPFTGLYIDLDSDYTTVFNTTITNSVWWGIDTTADSDYLNITDCTLTDNDCYGLCVHGCDHCTFRSNNLSNNLNGMSLFQGSTYCLVEDNYATQNTEYGVEIWSSNHNTITNNTFNMNSDWGIAVESCTNNTFSDNTVNNNTEYDYYAFSNAVDNIIENVTFSNNTFWLADSTSNWIIRYSENNLTEANRALNMTCYADNCTINLEGDTGFAINMTTLQTKVTPMSGSVEVGVDSSLIEIDYLNTTLNGVNFTNIDRPIMLKHSGVSTLMFSGTKNIYWCMKDLLYFINATSNRKAVSADTWTTNGSLDIDFEFRDLYPSSNFDIKYDSASFTTNTSSTTGTLEFNKSSWLTSAWYPLEIYMTTTPYRCGGVCAVDEGGVMMLYIDLNDSSVTHVMAEITKPNGETANHTMSDFLEDGATTWYLSYTDTGGAGIYSVVNFYSSKDNAVSWKQLDSFLTFTSRSTSGGGGGGGGGGAIDEPEPEPDDDVGGGGGAMPPPAEPEPEEHAVEPDKRFTATFEDGRATFTDSIVVSVASAQSGTVQIDQFKINPTSTSLIDGDRYGYVDIIVPDRNVGGTVCFITPSTWSASDTDLAVYHLENYVEWIELDTTRIGNNWCAEVNHYSYFSLASTGMRSVIESLTELSFDKPKIDGILLWHLNAEVYESKHTSNRELINVSSSEGVVCSISSEGDYPMRVLRCVYTPPEDAEWISMRYTGEIVALDADGYVKRIPIKIMVYDFDKLGFPIFIALVLIGGFILYHSRRFD